MAVPDEDSLSFTMRAVRWGSVTGSFFIWFPMGITFFGVLTAKRYRTLWKSADKKHSALKTCLELSTMTMMYHCGWRPSLGTEGNVFRFTVFYLTDTIIGNKMPKSSEHFEDAGDKVAFSFCPESFQLPCNCLSNSSTQHLASR